MARPPGIEIVRRAYELWEQAGKPEGRDQEFYLLFPVSTHETN